MFFAIERRVVRSIYEQPRQNFLQFNIPYLCASIPECNGILRFMPGVIGVDLLTASMVPRAFLIHVFIQLFVKTLEISTKIQFSIHFELLLKFAKSDGAVLNLEKSCVVERNVIKVFEC